MKGFHRPFGGSKVHHVTKNNAIMRSDRKREPSEPNQSIERKKTRFGTQMKSKPILEEEEDVIDFNRVLKNKSEMLAAEEKPTKELQIKVPRDRDYVERKRIREEVL